MFGMFGTLGVILQIAVLSFGYDAQLVMVIAVFACTAWLLHAMNNKDKWLFITNLMVLSFAIWGMT
jgi:hypothetical protein